MAELKQITDATFATDVEQSAGTVVVDFWAPWCGPCRGMEPILKKIADEHSELTIAQVNVDENPQTAMKFDVMSIPTYVVFKDGKVAKRFVGGMPEAKFLSEVEQA
ncbi:MAG: thioredoxin [Actinomycetia bacterium]|nr:thioredoxin [Actinomycetes bacterium]